MTFDDLEKASFKDAEKSLRDWKHCESLQQSDEKRFLELISKLLEKDYLNTPFDSLTCKSKNEILSRAIQGKYSTKVVNRLVEESFYLALSSPESHPYNASLISPLIEAYKKLDSDGQKNVERTISMRVAYELNDWHDLYHYHHYRGDFNQYHAERIHRRILDGIAHKDFINLMSGSVGMIGFEFIAPAAIDLLNQVSKKLGNSPPLSFYLTLDYQTKPLSRSSRTNKTKNEIVGNISGKLLNLPPENYIPDADPEDVIPKSDENSERRERREETREGHRRQIKEIEPVRDYLGAFFYDQNKGPHIILRVARIVDCANRLGVEVGELWDIVLIHEFAHLIHLSEDDSDGLFSTRHDSEFAELTAQLITWKVVKNTQMQPVFEKLSTHQSPKYQAWESIKDISLEDFRGFLSFLRKHNIPSNYEAAKSKYPILPAI